MESSRGIIRSHLREAVESRNYTFLQNYLAYTVKKNEYGSNTYTREVDEDTPLQIALDMNDIKMVKFLLEHNVDPNECYLWDVWRGYSPLHYALATRSTAMTMLLIKYGADIFTMTDAKIPPIYFAIKYNQVRIIRYLMDNGISPDTLINNKLSILNYAVIRGNMNVIKCILEHRPNINLHQHQQAIVGAVHTIGDHSNRLVKMLYKYGFTLHPTDIDHQLILAAIAKGLYDIVLNLLKLGTSPNMEIISDVGKEGTMLHVAVKAEKLKIIQLLLEYGANIHFCDTTGKTPILVAARKNNLHIIKLLLKHGANIADVDLLNRTVLHCAIMENMEDVYKNSNWCVNRNKTKIVRMLISKGANVNAKTYHTRTSPLHLAAQVGMPGVVQVLLAHGARVDKVNALRVTPLMFAQHQINNMIINHLERHPCMELRLATFQLLQQHIYRLRRVGLRVRSKDLVESDDEIFQLTDDASKIIDDEVQFIKKTEIGNSYITLHRFLTSTDKEAAGFVRNDVLLKNLKAMLYQPSKFPEYAELIRNKLTVALKKKELDRVTFKLMNFFFKEKELPSLSNECTEHIISFLSDKDRKVVTDQFTK